MSLLTSVNIAFFEILLKLPVSVGLNLREKFRVAPAAKLLPSKPPTIVNSEAFIPASVKAAEPPGKVKAAEPKL